MSTPFQVSVLATPTLILAANANRVSVEDLRHTGDQMTIYLQFGAGTANTGQGVRLVPNQGLPTITFKGDIYAIALEGPGDTISGIEN